MIVDQELKHYMQCAGKIKRIYLDDFREIGNRRHYMTWDSAKFFYMIYKNETIKIPYGPTISEILEQYGEPECIVEVYIRKNIIINIYTKKREG